MMQSITKKALFSASLVFIILLLDQIIKIWVKTSFYLGEELYITSFFRLVFVENNGMAFGISLGDKIYLTLFRIVASIAILIYLIYSIKKEAHNLSLASIALIFAGATGNIIDCVFYGRWFDYAPYFYGKVVDMFYFPVIETNWPEWTPFVGEEQFIFFRPIFNFADAAVCCGFIALVLFYSKYSSHIVEGL